MNAFNTSGDLICRRNSAMGRKRMAGSLPLVLLSFLVVVSAQPLGDNNGDKSSTAAAVNASSTSVATIDGREGLVYQVDQQQRPVENNSFDFRFQPKTTGKGSWTAIKIWGGEERRTSRADRVVSSAAESSQFSAVNLIFTLLAALTALVL